MRQADRFATQMKNVGAEVGILCAGPAEISDKSLVSRAVSRGKINLYELTRTQFNIVRSQVDANNSIALPVKGSSIESAHDSFDSWLKDIYCRAKDHLDLESSACLIENIPVFQEGESKNCVFFVHSLFNRAHNMLKNKLDNVSIPLPDIFFGVESSEGTYVLMDKLHKLHEVSCLSLEKVCTILRPNNNRFMIFIFGSKSIERWLNTSYFCFEESWYGHDVVTVQSANSYSSIVFNLLNAMHSEQLKSDYINTFLEERKAKSASFMYKSKTYLRKKYCPHRGADLSGCTANGLGQIICPAHGWIYDLLTGKCIDGDLSSSINT